MIDIKFLRENPEAVKENIKKKFQDSKLPLVDEVIALDEESRKTKQEADDLRANRNKLSKEIGALMAQGKKEEAEARKAEVAAGARRLVELEEKEKKLEEIAMMIAKKAEDSLGKTTSKTGGTDKGKGGGDGSGDQGTKISFTGTFTHPIGNSGWGGSATGTVNIGSNGITTGGNVSPVQGAIPSVGFGASASGSFGSRGGSWRVGGNVNIPTNGGHVGYTFFGGISITF